MVSMYVRWWYILGNVGGSYLILLLGFLGSLPMWSKSPNDKARISHLFKWKEVILERDTVREIHLRGQNSYKSLRERKKERENHCNFRIPTRKYFSYCNCWFVHRWIRLIFGQQVLHTWYFKFSGWIGKKISIKRDKCFSLSALYFEVLASWLYCTN